jgi:hypothetical protein
MPSPRYLWLLLLLLLLLLVVLLRQVRLLTANFFVWTRCPPPTARYCYCRAGDALRLLHRGLNPGLHRRKMRHDARGRHAGLHGRDSWPRLESDEVCWVRLLILICDHADRKKDDSTSSSARAALLQVNIAKRDLL